MTYYYVSDRPSGERAQQNKGYGTTDRMQASPQESGVAKGQQRSAPPRENAGESSAGGVPPSYDQAVRGDHKVQT